MSRLYSLLLCLFVAASAQSQFYLRGEVRDEQGRAIPNIRLLFRSKGNFPYYTGSGGGFGVPCNLKVDTLSIDADGYESFKSAVRSGQYEIFTLKMTAVKANSSRQRLSSLTKNLLTSKLSVPDYTGESYSSSIENDFVETHRFPETGYAVNVDRASYSNIRRFLNLNDKPPVDAVRIEEILNYFNPVIKGAEERDGVFTVNTAVTSCPWNPESSLFFINLRAKQISLANTPPSNLVFLVDVSGSMDMPNRLPLLKTGFKLMVQNLRNIDTVSLISYANGVSIMLPPTPGNEKQKIIEAIEGLSPSGATSGEAAILTAYRYAARSYIPGGNNRVILATDGDFNVGLTSEKELEELIAKQRQTGIYLTCIGVGMGNYKDSKLEVLSKKGNGNFAYLDNEQEAEKVMVEEFAQTLFTVANDVFVNVQFNPKVVKNYRLIGFDNKQSAIADSIGDLEGGEVGSGHSLITVFEIVCDSIIKKPSYEPLASLKLSYSLPGTPGKIATSFNAQDNFKSLSTADSSLRYAASLIMFGGLLKQSKFFKDVLFDDVISLALSAANPANRLQMEFIELLQKAKKLYGKRKRRD